MTNKATLNSLINFLPENEIESIIFNVNKSVLNKYLKHTKQYWSDGKFYLGGQILIEKNEEITFSKINNIKEIQKQKNIDIGACNSFEIASINACKRDLNEMEIILEKYQEIYKLRITNILCITILKKDLSNLIISYLF
jgi:hypothetical protein